MYLSEKKDVCLHLSIFQKRTLSQRIVMDPLFLHVVKMLLHPIARVLAPAFTGARKREEGLN